MILEDLMNVLRSRGNVLVIANNDRSMPKKCRLVAVPDFVRIDDYLPDDVLSAPVTKVDIDEVPVHIYVDLDGE